MNKEGKKTSLFIFLPDNYHKDRNKTVKNSTDPGKDIMEDRNRKTYNTDIRKCRI